MHYAGYIGIVVELVYMYMFGEKTKLAFIGMCFTFGS